MCFFWCAFLMMFSLLNSDFHESVMESLRKCAGGDGGGDPVKENFL